MTRCIPRLAWSSLARSCAAALLAAVLAAPSAACGRTPAETSQYRLPFPVKLLILDDSAGVTSGALLADTLDRAREAQFNMAAVRVDADSTSEAAEMLRVARTRRLATVAVVAPLSVPGAADAVPDAWLCRAAGNTTAGAATPTTASRCLNLAEPAVRRHALGLVGQAARIAEVDAVVIDLSRVRMDHGAVSRSACEKETGVPFGQWPADVQGGGERAARDAAGAWQAWWAAKAMLFARDAKAAVHGASERALFGLWIRANLPGSNRAYDSLVTVDLASCAVAANAAGGAKPDWPVADFILLDAAPTWFPADGPPARVSEVCRLAARCFGPAPIVPCVCLEGDEAAHVTEEALTGLYQESGGLAFPFRALPYPEEAWLDLTRVLEAPRRQLE